MVNLVRTATLQMSDDANGNENGEAPPPPAPAATLRAASTMSAAAPSKTKRHWRVLRNALVSKTRDQATDATASSISTAFFPQYRSELATRFDVTSTGGPISQAAPNFEWQAYFVTKSVAEEVGNGAQQEGATRHVFVHEKQKNQRVSLAELFSHKLNNGVDNTGNIRTWPSEQILLAYLLQNQTCKTLAGRKGSKIKCCELGAGMAGLAALGLLAHEGDSIEHALITDGNPQSVENLEVCLRENLRRGVVTTSNTTTCLLRWDRTAQFSSAMRHHFDLVIASDCLFFEDFHHDLAHTIKELLVPQSGVCYLLQPSRNGSMERFCSIARQHYSLQIDIVDNYDPKISLKHQHLVQSQRDDYVPDVHLPVLLVVTSRE